MLRLVLISFFAFLVSPSIHAQQEDLERRLAYRTLERYTQIPKGPQRFKTPEALRIEFDQFVVDFAEHGDVALAVPFLEAGDESIIASGWMSLKYRMKKEVMSPQEAIHDLMLEWAYTHPERFEKYLKLLQDKSSYYLFKIKKLMDARDLERALENLLALDQYAPYSQDSLKAHQLLGDQLMEDGRSLEAALVYRSLDLHYSRITEAQTVSKKFIALFKEFDLDDLIAMKVQHAKAWIRVSEELKDPALLKHLREILKELKVLAPDKFTEEGLKIGLKFTSLPYMRAGVFLLHKLAHDFTSMDSKNRNMAYSIMHRLDKDSFHGPGAQNVLYSLEKSKTGQKLSIVNASIRQNLICEALPLEIRGQGHTKRCSGEDLLLHFAKASVDSVHLCHQLYVRDAYTHKWQNMSYQPPLNSRGEIDFIERPKPLDCIKNLEAQIQTATLKNHLCYSIYEHMHDFSIPRQMNQEELDKKIPFAAKVHVVCIDKYFNSITRSLPHILKAHENELVSRQESLFVPNSTGALVHMFLSEGKGPKKVLRLEAQFPHHLELDLPDQVKVEREIPLEFQSLAISRDESMYALHSKSGHIFMNQNFGNFKSDIFIDLNKEMENAGLPKKEFEFSPDKKLLLVSSEEKAVLFSVETQKPVMQFNHTAKSANVSFNLATGEVQYYQVKPHGILVDIYSVLGKKLRSEFHNIEKSTDKQNTPQICGTSIYYMDKKEQMCRKRISKDLTYSLFFLRETRK